MSKTLQIACLALLFAVSYSIAANEAPKVEGGWKVTSVESAGPVYKIWRDHLEVPMRQSSTTNP